MSTTLRTRITAAVTVALGGTALAVGAVLAGAPASAATLAELCVQRPAVYAPTAVRGVYSVQKRGIDRDRICKVYDAAGRLQGTITETDYGFYRLTGPVSPPPVKSSF